MKYKLLAIAMLMSISSVFAQDDAGEDSSGGASSSSEMTVGVKFGGNLNNFDHPGTTFGGHFGGYFRMDNLVEVAGFTLGGQAELMYQVQGGGRDIYYRSIANPPGSNISNSGLLVDGYTFLNRKVALHNVVLPVSARISPVGTGAVKPTAVLGMAFNYTAAAFEVADKKFIYQRSPLVNAPQSILSNQRENIGAELNNVYATAHVGVQTDFELNNGKTFGMELRYQFALIDINVSQSRYADMREQLKPTAFNLSFYYTILNF